MKKVTNDILTKRFKEVVDFDRESYDDYYVIDEYPYYVINIKGTVRRLDNGKMMAQDSRGRYCFSINGKRTWVYADSLKKKLSKITVTDEDVMTKAHEIGCAISEPIKELVGITDPIEREVVLIQKIKRLKNIMHEMEEDYIRQIKSLKLKYKLLQEQYNELTVGKGIPEEDAKAAFAKLMGWSAYAKTKS